MTSIPSPPGSLLTFFNSTLLNLYIFFLTLLPVIISPLFFYLTPHWMDASFSCSAILAFLFPPHFPGPPTSPPSVLRSNKLSTLFSVTFIATIPSLHSLTSTPHSCLPWPLLLPSTPTLQPCHPSPYPIHSFHPHNFLNPFSRTHSLQSFFFLSSISQFKYLTQFYFCT